jgi:hypothetical protein
LEKQRKLDAEAAEEKKKAQEAKREKEKEERKERERLKKEEEKKKKEAEKEALRIKKAEAEKKKVRRRRSKRHAHHIISHCLAPRSASDLDCSVSKNLNRKVATVEECTVTDVFPTTWSRPSRARRS